MSVKFSINTKDLKMLMEKSVYCSKQESCTSIAQTIVF